MDDVVLCIKGDMSQEEVHRAIRTTGRITGVYQYHIISLLYMFSLGSVVICPCVPMQFSLLILGK